MYSDYHVPRTILSTLQIWNHDLWQLYELGTIIVPHFAC